MALCCWPQGRPAPLLLGLTPVAGVIRPPGVRVVRSPVQWDGRVIAITGHNHSCDPVWWRSSSGSGPDRPGGLPDGPPPRLSDPSFGPAACALAAIGATPLATARAQPPRPSAGGPLTQSAILSLLASLTPVGAAELDGLRSAQQYGVDAVLDCVLPPASPLGTATVAHRRVDFPPADATRDRRTGGGLVLAVDDGCVICAHGPPPA